MSERKTHRWNRTSLAAVAVLALSSWGAFASPHSDTEAQQPTFRILNMTGIPATGLYAVRESREDWGRNLLAEGRPLTAGAGFSLRVNESAGCRFNIRLVLESGTDTLVRGHDVCTDKLVMVTPVSARSVQPSPRGGLDRTNITSGTGFVVAPGHILTNQHVVGACQRLMVRSAEGRDIAAGTLRVDQGSDLALLSVPGITAPPLTFRISSPVRRGDGVVTYGSPLAGLLSSGPTLTTGEVSALSGLEDNAAQFQISAPVQPGSSGGPLLDRRGRVVGVVVSKLNAQRVAQRTGDIPQNVNFAVKGEAAMAFLRSAGIEPRSEMPVGPQIEAAEVGEIAHASTFLIRCEQ